MSNLDLHLQYQTNQVMVLQSLYHSYLLANHYLFHQNLQQIVSCQLFFWFQNPFLLLVDRKVGNQSFDCFHSLDNKLLHYHLGHNCYYFYLFNYINHYHSCRCHIHIHSRIIDLIDSFAHVLPFFELFLNLFIFLRNKIY